MARVVGTNGVTKADVDRLRDRRAGIAADARNAEALIAAIDLRATTPDLIEATADCRARLATLAEHSARKLTALDEVIGECVRQGVDR